MPMEARKSFCNSTWSGTVLYGGVAHIGGGARQGVKGGGEEEGISRDSDCKIAAGVLQKSPIHPQTLSKDRSGGCLRTNPFAIGHVHGWDIEKNNRKQWRGVHL